MKRAAVVLVAGALALGSAGCGGGGGNGRLSRSEYEAKLQTITHDLAPTLSALLAFDPHDLKQAPLFLTTLADGLQRVADGLTGVRPPQDASASQARLVGGARSAAKELRTLAAKLRASTPAQVRLLLARFDPRRLSGLQRLAQAATDLAARGYRLSSTADR